MKKTFFRNYADVSEMYKNLVKKILKTIIKKKV